MWSTDITDGLDRRGFCCPSLPRVTKPVAQINRSRLQLLIYALCALVAVGYGVVLLTSAYTPFAKRFIHQQQVQSLELRTGKSYAQWQQEQSVQCSKEYAGSREAQEWMEIHYRICMSIPVTELVPESDVALAFLAEKAHWFFGYILSTVFITWFMGFLVVKAIPAGTSRFWTWLTTNEKTH